MVAQVSVSNRDRVKNSSVNKITNEFLTRLWSDIAGKRGTPAETVAVRSATAQLLQKFQVDLSNSLYDSIQTDPIELSSIIKILNSDDKTFSFKPDFDHKNQARLLLTFAKLKSYDANDELTLVGALKADPEDFRRFLALIFPEEEKRVAVTAAPANLKPNNKSLHAATGSPSKESPTEKKGPGLMDRIRALAKQEAIHLELDFIEEIWREIDQNYKIPKNFLNDKKSNFQLNLAVTIDPGTCNSGHILDLLKNPDKAQTIIEQVTNIKEHWLLAILSLGKTKEGNTLGDFLREPEVFNWLYGLIDKYTVPVEPEKKVDQIKRKKLNNVKPSPRQVPQGSIASTSVTPQVEEKNTGKIAVTPKVKNITAPKHETVTQPNTHTQITKIATSDTNTDKQEKPEATISKEISDPQEALITRQATVINGLQDQIAVLGNRITELQQQINHERNSNTNLELTISLRDRSIDSLKSRIAQQLEELNQSRKLLNQNKYTIANQKSLIGEQERKIQLQAKEIVDKSSKLQFAERQIAAHQEQIANLEESLNELKSLADKDTNKLERTHKRSSSITISLADLIKSRLNKYDAGQTDSYDELMQESLQYLEIEPSTKASHKDLKATDYFLALMDDYNNNKRILENIISNEDKVKLVLAVISLNPDSRMYFQHSRDDFIKFLDKLKALPIKS